MNPKQKTVGVSPKVPAQAIATVIVFIAARFGLELDPELAGALGVLIGAAAGGIASPGTVR